MMYGTYADTFKASILLHDNSDVFNSTGIILYSELGIDGELPENGNSGFVSTETDDMLCFVLNQMYDPNAIEVKYPYLPQQVTDSAHILRVTHPKLFKKDFNGAEKLANTYGEEFKDFLNEHPEIVKGVKLLAEKVLLYEADKRPQDKYVTYLQDSDTFRIPHITARFKNVYIQDDEKLHPATTYEFTHIRDFFYFYLTTLIKHEIRLKRCNHCERYFIADRVDSSNCQRLAPEDARKSCREYVNYQNGMKKKKTDEAQGLYKQITNMLRQQLNRSVENISRKNGREKALNGFMEEATQWKTEVKEGITSKEAYIEWLKEKQVEFKQK